MKPVEGRTSILIPEQDIDAFNKVLINFIVSEENVDAKMSTGINVDRCFEDCSITSVLILFIIPG